MPDLSADPLPSAGCGSPTFYQQGFGRHDMAGERGVWTEFFRVRSDEVDPSGHVPIATLCNYLQEASGNHARALGFAAEVMLERGLAWVLGRLHLEIERYPEGGTW